MSLFGLDLSQEKFSLEKILEPFSISKLENLQEENGKGKGQVGIDHSARLDRITLLPFQSNELKNVEKMAKNREELISELLDLLEIFTRQESALDGIHKVISPADFEVLSDQINSIQSQKYNNEEGVDIKETLNGDQSKRDSKLRDIETWFEKENNIQSDYHQLLVECLNLKLQITEKRLRESEDGELAAFYRYALFNFPLVRKSIDLIRIGWLICHKKLTPSALCRNEIKIAIKLLKQKTVPLDARLRQYLMLGDDFMEIVDEIIDFVRNEGNNEELGIVLEESIMHPQGGGQESDKGSLTFKKFAFEDRVAKFPVTRLDYHRGSGILIHWVTTDQELDIAEGDEVLIEIDGDNRFKNAKLHSAGHLIDVIATKLKPTWVPAKGMHFQSTSWVEFKGSIDPSEKDSFKTQFQSEIDSLVAEDLELIVSMAEGERRKVSFIGYNQCECGGTHVKRSGQLIGLKIEKIQKSKDCVRIKYSV